MPLDSYDNLQTSVADWIARPGDPLLLPAIPDMILLFEEKARDKLRTRFVEKTVTLAPPANTDTIPLPLDYAQLRHMYIQTSNGKRHFSFQTPVNMDTNFFYLDGYPVSYTIEGLNLRVVGNTGSTPDPITLDYFTGLRSLRGGADQLAARPIPERLPLGHARARRALHRRRPAHPALDGGARGEL